MHSFNYNEQANQLQQQQILPDQDYASESVTADYNLGSESSIDTHKQSDVHVNEEFTYSINGIEQSGNNIDNEEVTYQVKPTTYFDKMADTSAISTKFYTTLPNREAAEKLAALAAAGHVNSRLIGQLQKQQKKDTQKNTMPPNHKDDDLANQQQINDDEQMYNQQKSYHESQQHRHRQNFKVQNNEKLPLQIMIPDDKDDYVTSDDDQQSNIKRDNTNLEYEYDDGEIGDSQSTTLFKTTSHDNNSHAEFGTRLHS